MMRMHMAGVVMRVGVSGTPRVVYSLWGPNQLSAASELETHNVPSLYLQCPP